MRPWPPRPNLPTSPQPTIAAPAPALSSSGTAAQPPGTRERGGAGDADRHAELAARLAALGAGGQSTNRSARTAPRRDAREGAIEQAPARGRAGANSRSRAGASAPAGGDRRLHRLDQEHENAAQRLQSLHSELSTLADSDRSLAEQMAVWQMDLDARVATLTDAEARLADAEQQVRDADTALTDADHALGAARRAAHEPRVGAAPRRVALHGAVRSAHGDPRTPRDGVARPLEDLMTSFDAVDVEDELLRAEAEQLRSELEKLGPVNPLAVEEHEEEVKRLDVLTTQRNDLSEAKNKLQLAIREIDTTARELFLATFTQVRENFRQIFMTLFGGGECDLRLENPELPLDCDIEVHASPRGKRTQRIHLLSSGERALVALSLLFGIFLTKPSPFCLLDEVDAPLDDANIGRYVRMLNQFKGKTQFIVITPTRAPRPRRPTQCTA
jgi:chromosome segregation protein